MQSIILLLTAQLIFHMIAVAWDILQCEGIDATRRIMPAQLEATDLDNTLLCFVLVDADGKHAFCSRYDFGPWPLLSGISNLPSPVLQVSQWHSRAAQTLFRAAQEGRC
jgi:hypothetical protein